MIWNRLGRLGLGGRLALVSGLLAAGWMSVAPLAFQLHGVTGLAAASVGALTCWFGGAAALAVLGMVRGGTAAIYVVGLATMVRMSTALILGVTLHLRVPGMARGGMIFYLLAFYMLMLAAETALALAEVPHGKTAKQGGLT